jgi:hypothetical protein
MSEIKWLGFITEFENVGSILQHGILSHKLASKLPHSSCANNEVQEIRRCVKTPNGKWLHEHANLYLNPRNPMLYSLHRTFSKICILCVNPTVMAIPGAMVTDRNASTGPRFGTAENWNKIIDYQMTFAASWDHADETKKREHKSVMCAELLVPDKIPSTYIRGAYVAGEAQKDKLLLMYPNLKIAVNRYLFFNK